MTNPITSTTSSLLSERIFSGAEIVVIQQDLENWCLEKKYTPEYTKRQEAAERILEVYNNNGNCLSLIEAGLSSLPQSIGKLSQLKVLDLTGNQLQSLPAEIGNLSQLEKLNLFINQLQSVPVELGKLSQLKVLDLSGNQLQSVPIELGNLVQLERLHISGNQLQSVPVELGNLSLLQELDLSANQLQSIPAELGKLTLLQELYLYNNQLQSLPVELGNLSQLIALNLSGNQLQSLPVELGNLSRLERLLLFVNQLQSVPVELGTLSRLTVLNLARNQLQSVPAELGNLSLLRELNLSSNQLQSLPVELVHFSSFCQVNLEHNFLLSMRAIQTFHIAISARRSTHPNQGPIVRFSNQAHVSTGTSNTLQQALTFWIRASGAEVDLSSYQSLIAHDQSDMLMVFLDKLRQTQDFKNIASQFGVVKLVNQMLKSACTNEVFQEKMFLLLHDANDTCHDRTAITLGRMELEWHFICNLRDVDAVSLAKLIIGYRRLELLNEISDKKIAEKGLGDAIETKLYYQTRLKDALGLPISTGDMLYEAMSGITTEELEDAALEILSVTSSNEDRTRILLESERGSEAWKNLIEKEHSEAFSEISEFYLGKMNDLDYDLPQEKYMNQMNAIVEEKKQKTEELMRDLTAEYLNHSAQG
jgi:Leucine-rich repeat (LRR) protein